MRPISTAASERAGRQPSTRVSGDEFEEWVRASWSLMRMIAERVAGQSHRDEALQEALLAAWRHRDSYDMERGSARSWLAAITTNAAKRTARQAARAVTAGLEDSGPDLSDELSNHLETLEVDAAIRRLPERQRLAVELHYFVDMSIQETASAMGCAEGTVKASLFAARANLKKYLSEEM